jgi:hypothetical protein
MIYQYCLPEEVSESSKSELGVDLRDLWKWLPSWLSNWLANGVFAKAPRIIRSMIRRFWPWLYNSMAERLRFRNIGLFRANGQIRREVLSPMLGPCWLATAFHGDLTPLARQGLENRDIEDIFMVLRRYPVRATQALQYTRKLRFAVKALYAFDKGRFLHVRFLFAVSMDDLKMSVDWASLGSFTAETDEQVAVQSVLMVLQDLAVKMYKDSKDPVEKLSKCAREQIYGIVSRCCHLNLHAVTRAAQVLGDCHCYIWLQKKPLHGFLRALGFIKEADKSADSSTTAFKYRDGK